MAKHRKDPSKTGLSAASVEGQGTTTREFDSVSKDSSRKKNKRQ